MRRVTRLVSLVLGRNGSIGARENERGAVMVLVAVSMVALLGAVAMSVDFGRIYSERFELQNGADAAAMAIAQDCASGECNGGYDETAVAEQYADANASDGTASIEQIDFGAKQVRVRTATEDADDNTLDMLFAQAVGFDGFTVRAEASAEWGPAKEATIFPIAISQCEWASLRGSLRPSSDVHSGDIPSPSNARIVVHGVNRDEESLPCPSGGIPRGGFVRLDHGCSHDTQVGAYLDTDLQLGGDGCWSNSLFDEIVLIPYFDEFTSDDKIHVAGFGAILITAYDLRHLGEQSLYSLPEECDGPEPRECIEAYVIDELISGDEIAGSDFGVDVAKFTG